jgi:hypothetical protein
MGRLPEIPGCYKCVKCKRHLPFAEFAPRESDASWREKLNCRACCALPRKGRGRAGIDVGGQKFFGVRHFIAEYKAGRPCADCGLVFHPSAMEFDHVRGEKKFTLSRVTGSIEATLEEIAKCELVCACCHRVRTHNRHQRPGTPRVPFGPIRGADAA